MTQEVIRFDDDYVSRSCPNAALELDCFSVAQRHLPNPFI
jgi:hypothetical protein